MRTLIGSTEETNENSDESMANLSDAELAPEADKLSVGSLEEIVVIQGIIYSKVHSSNQFLVLIKCLRCTTDLIRDLSQHLPHSTVFFHQIDVILIC